jgi:hypothetical protein
MIRRSDNDAANWVYSELNAPRREINRVARDANMKRYTLIAQPGYPYIIGQSAITASDFASFFSKIFTMVPGAQRNLARYLLAHLSDDDQKGMLQAGIHGVVYSKEGWTATDPGYAGYPYVVNQVARFNYGHTWYSVAVTVGRITNETAGETITKNIVHALVGTYTADASDPRWCSCGAGEVDGVDGRGELLAWPHDRDVAVEIRSPHWDAEPGQFGQEQRTRMTVVVVQANGDDRDPGVHGR